MRGVVWMERRAGHWWNVLSAGETLAMIPALIYLCVFLHESKSRLRLETRDRPVGPPRAVRSQLSAADG